MFVNPFAREADDDLIDVIIPLPTSLDGEDALSCLKKTITDDSDTSSPTVSYDRKSKCLNRAITDIGFGKYQRSLFFLAGMGWLADNLWLQGVAVALPGIQVEFGVPPEKIGFVTMALFVGLCIGATIWGIMSDIIGRRIAFNATLLIAGVFGVAAGAGPSFIGVTALLACVGVGIGGNLPVDGALFLEFLPQSSGNLLTLLSIWWPIGQLISSMVGWAFLPSYTCAPSEQTPCHSPGFRYLFFTIGALTLFMAGSRFFLFRLYESPKYLISRGKDLEAVRVIQRIARENKRKTWLTIELLNEIGMVDDVVKTEKSKLTTMQIVRQNFSRFSLNQIRPLFSTFQMGYSIILIWLCWASIGMAFPLFNSFLPIYLQNAGGSGDPVSTYIVYRNYAIISIIGVPGAILACYTVDIKFIGRKGTMAASTFLTGICLFLFTVWKESNSQLAFSCLTAFFQNVMYGTLYAYTPEFAAAPVRGTVNGLASFFNRLFGLFAPLIATNSFSGKPSVPIYVSGGLTIFAGIAMVLLPVETRGRERL